MAESGGGARRRRVVGGRPHKFTVRFTDEELERVSARAAAARVSVPAFLALAALHSAEGTQLDAATVRAFAAEIFALRRQVNRLGHNVNQVAHLLHGTGEVEANAAETYRAAGEAIQQIDPLLSRLSDFLPGGAP